MGGEGSRRAVGARSPCPARRLPGTTPTHPRPCCPPRADHPQERGPDRAQHVGQSVGAGGWAGCWLGQAGGRAAAQPDARPGGGGRRRAAGAGRPAAAWSLRRRAAGPLSRRPADLPTCPPALHRLAPPRSDEEVFPDPDTFNIHRDNADRQVAYGSGTHRCEPRAAAALGGGAGRAAGRAPQRLVACGSGAPRCGPPCACADTALRRAERAWGAGRGPSSMTCGLRLRDVQVHRYQLRRALPAHPPACPPARPPACHSPPPPPAPSVCPLPGPPSGIAEALSLVKGRGGRGGRAGWRRQQQMALGCWGREGARRERKVAAPAARGDAVLRRGAARPRRQAGSRASASRRHGAPSRPPRPPAPPHHPRPTPPGGAGGGVQGPVPPPAQPEADHLGGPAAVSGRGRGVRPGREGGRRQAGRQGRRRRGSACARWGTRLRGTTWLPQAAL